MTTNPLFSVITVTLNHISGLQQTHDSLSSQTCKNYEWIVIDGGSFDSSAAYLETTKAHWVSEKDGGIYDAMNKGISRARGQYLIFMNAGDCFAAPDTLALIKALITEQAPDFIYGDALEYSGGSAVYKTARPHAKICERMITHHQSMIYRREMIGDKKYDIHYAIAADYDFTFHFLKNCVTEPTYLQAPLCIFETGGISQQQARKGRTEQFKIRKNHGMSWAQNFYIFMAQSGLYTMRQIFPSLYWRLKRA